MRQRLIFIHALRVFLKFMEINHRDTEDTEKDLYKKLFSVTSVSLWLKSISEICEISG